MASAVWPSRARSNRKGRSFKRNFELESEEIKLDLSKDINENLKEVLSEIVNPVAKNKISYLNAFVKLCRHGNLKDSIYTSNEIIYCLRTLLVSQTKELRIAGIRAIRYFLHDEETIDAFISLKVDFLICRCIDIVLDNQLERAHALKLVRKILNVCPKKVTCALLRCVVSLANDEPMNQEKFVRASLCIISELAIINTSLCAECGGLTTIINKVMDIQQPWINEAMMGVILFLLNRPETRKIVLSNVRIEQIVAPFTDVNYRHSAESSETNASDERNARIQASKIALLSAFRSWSGLVLLSQPHFESGLKSLMNVMYLENTEIQKGVMDIIFELFRIPVPKWTSDFSAALVSIDPSTPKHSWDLYEGFVAEEGKDILLNQSKFRLNILDDYLALLLFTFVNAGVLNALIEVAAKSCCKFTSVRATILLAELLNLTSSLLPSECSRHCQALPKLLLMATSIDIPKQHRNQASIIVSNLTMVHKLKKRAPVPSSLFLDQQIRFCSSSSQNRQRTSVGDLMSRSKLESCVKVSDDLLNQAINNSLVLRFSDYNKWDWNIISSCVFKWVTDNFKRLEDVNHKAFVRRIVNFFKPSSRQFCDLPLTKENSLLYSSSAVHLIEFLLDAEELGDCSKIHDEWMKDIVEHLSGVKQNSVTSEIFSPHKLTRTLAQHYFLFFGKLSSSSKGCKILERSGIFQLLLEIIDGNCNSCYVKLIASCLDYSKPVLSRILLNKIITSSSEESRLYGANILIVLLRAKLPDFHKWVIELLVTLLYDKNSIVSQRALSVLDEACNNPVNLDALIQMRPSFLHLGDEGLLLLIRFLSMPSGFNFLRNANFINHELKKWEKSFLVKYVDIVEARLNQALTRHQKNEHGAYGRHDSEKHVIRDIYLPAHLYGQLSQHDEGFTLLLQQTDYLQNLLITVQEMKIETEKQINELKAAVWALGHIGTSVSGITFLNNREIIPDIVKLAEECPVFSVRGTCFYVMGLMSSTSIGSNLLSQVGWQSKRQHRLEKWPVIIQKHHFDDDLAVEYMRHYSSSSSDSRYDSELALHNSETYTFSSSPQNYNTRSCRSMSNTDQVNGNRMRSTSSFCHLSSLNAENRHLSREESDCKNERHPSVSIENENCCPSSLNFNSLSSGSCKVLHVRQSSASFLQIGQGTSDVAICETKERSQSLSEKKSERKSDVILKVDSDTKLQNLTKQIDTVSSTRSDFLKTDNEDSSYNKPDDKIRSNSYADSTTSGISSCESYSARNSQLSPELSALVIENNFEYMDSVRKRVQLRSTPGLIRHHSVLNQVSYPAQCDTSSIVSSLSLDNSIFNFTSSKNVIGYETLKSLQRSPDIETSIHPLCLRSSKFHRSSRASTTLRGKSFEESLSSSRASTSSSSTAATEITLDANIPRYMGVCLPIDTLMIFSIYDEDSCENHVSELNCGKMLEENGLIFHSQLNCISCHKYEITSNGSSNASKMASPTDELDCENSSSGSRKISPTSGLIIANSGTPVTSLHGSCTSGSSVDFGSQPNSDKIASIRRELIKIVVNLSSSVAVKSLEQNLLNMKQKYAYAFQDICLYSEICHLMSTYRFRYSVRKFVQDCFHDLQFDVLSQDAELILKKKF